MPRSYFTSRGSQHSEQQRVGLQGNVNINCHAGAPEVRIHLLDRAGIATNNIGSTFLDQYTRQRPTSKVTSCILRHVNFALLLVFDY